MFDSFIILITLLSTMGKIETEKPLNSQYSQMTVLVVT